MADDKNLSTIQTYVGDMYALESHIEQAIDAREQLNRISGNELAGFDIGGVAATGYPTHEDNAWIAASGACRFAAHPAVDSHNS